MRGRIRKNKWIDRVLNNGPNMIMIEQKEGDWYYRDGHNSKEKPNVHTTVFVCDDCCFNIGNFSDGEFTGRCVMEHEPNIRWENYGKYFPMNKIKLATCYMKMHSDIEKAACELTEYIVMHEIYGNILLIGFGYGGLMMYRVGTLLPNNYKTAISVLTIAAPFADVVQENNKILPNMIEPLPQGRKHIAFINDAESLKEHSRLYNAFHGNPGHKGIISIERQDEWPRNGQRTRMPDMVTCIRLEQHNVMKEILDDFGMFVDGEEFFSRLDEFYNSREYNLIVENNQ